MTVLKRILKASDPQDNSVQLQVANDAVNEEDLQGQIQGALRAGQFSIVIQLLAQLQDFQNGITHSEILPAAAGAGSNDDATLPILLRDASNVKDAPEIDQRISCLQQILGLLRGAELLGSSQDGEQSLYLQFLASFAYDSLFVSKDASPKDVLAVTNTYLVAHVTLTYNISPAEAKKRLRVAREFASMDTPTRIIATRINMLDDIGRSRDVFEIDVPQTQLTDNQKKTYNNIKEGKRRPTWFTYLRTWERNLTEHASTVICDSDYNTVMPARLQKYLVGVRNHYKKSWHVVHRQVPGSAELATTCELTHSAAVSFMGCHGNDNEYRQTQENVRQLQQQFSAEPTKPVVLLSSGRSGRADRKADRIAKAATAKNSTVEHQVDVIALKLMKLICNNELRVQTKVMSPQGVVDITKRNLISDEVQCFILRGIGDYDVLRLEVLERTNYSNNAYFKPAILAAMDCRKHMKSSGPKLVVAVANLSAELTRLGVEHPQVVVTYQNGTDRTGVVLHAIAREFVTNTLGRNANTDKNHVRLAKAGHTQFMAAAAGGSIGSMGQSSRTLKAFPAEWKRIKKYFRSPMADVAHQIPTHKAKHDLSDLMKRFQADWDNAGKDAATGNVDAAKRLKEQKALIDTLLGLRIARTQMKGRRRIHSPAKAQEKRALLEDARQRLSDDDFNQLPELLKQLRDTHIVACKFGGMKKGSTGKLLDALDKVINQAVAGQASAAPSNARAQTDFFANTKHHIMKLEKEKFVNTWKSDGAVNGNKQALLRILRLAKEHTERKGSRSHHNANVSARKAEFLAAIISRIEEQGDHAINRSLVLQGLMSRDLKNYNHTFGHSHGDTGATLDFIVKKIGRPPTAGSSDDDDYNEDNDSGFWAAL